MILNVKFRILNQIIQGQVSKPFNIWTGLWQGEGLSPMIFNFALKKVIRTNINENGGVNIEINNKILEYVYDIAALRRNQENIETH